MDPRRNPFAPGAGARPPELAGREPLLERALVALDRIRAGQPARSTIFYGLRGVGKTVLLGAIRQAVEVGRMLAVTIEAPENRSLPALIAPSLRAGRRRPAPAARPDGARQIPCRTLVRDRRPGAARRGCGRRSHPCAGEREKERITADAVAAIVRDTQGYPYFLQQWGKHSWDVADASPITVADVDADGAASADFSPRCEEAGSPPTRGRRAQISWIGP